MDMGGLTGRKNFLKRGGKPKNWGAGGARRWSGGTPDRACGAIFGSGNEASSSVARGALLADTVAAGVRLRSRRFAPLIYGGSVRELHRSPYRGIPACPARIS